jgi:hypothetical protein
MKSNFLSIERERTLTPLYAGCELNVGERQIVILPDGSKTDVTVLDLDVRSDTIRAAIRMARVRVMVNGECIWVPVAGYNLPSTVGGFQVDCPAIRMLSNKREDVWRLERDVRLRFWSAGSPWIRPGTMRYPARQRWFATDTQMCNEPCFVGGAEYAGRDRIYYHDGLDIGGSEGDTELIAAADGILLGVGERIHERAQDYELQPRYDRVFLLDGRDWVHIYSHVKTIVPKLRPGMAVTMGDPIGFLGKEGSSGGWSHLHYGIKARQPSGMLASEEGYPFLWQTYCTEYVPKILAVARPHQFVPAGQPVVVDGSRSWAASSEGIANYHWQFSDGTEARRASVKRIYSRPGIYSEILTVRDAKGNVSVDFAVVQVIGRYEADALPPGIHATYHPTLDLRPGLPVTFKVRSFYVERGEEVWNFGDGSPAVSVSSVPVGSSGSCHHSEGYASCKHVYAKPGRYIATATRKGSNELTATTRLCVVVEE